MTISTRALISTSDLTPQELTGVIERAIQGKQSNWREHSTALAGKVIALMFFNPSLRTRASFQAGIARLGGQSVVLAPGSDSWTLEFEEGALMYRDRTEHVKDASGVLSQYFDAVCIRSFPALKSWEEDKNEPVLSAFKKHLDIPLVSMESALWHPCQALADAVTRQARTDYERWIAWKSDELDRVRRFIEERHRWSSAYSRLKEIRLQLREVYLSA